VPPGLTDVTAIAAGYMHSLALRADGTVIAWGYNYYGQTNVPAGLNAVKMIAAGGYHNLALRVDGTVVAWGDNSHHQCSVPTNLSAVTAVACGDDHSLALKSDGTVVAWGENYYQQCNVPTNLSNVVAISAGAGAYRSLAVLQDGFVVGWGEFSSVPEEIAGVRVISSGYSHALVLFDPRQSYAARQVDPTFVMSGGILGRAQWRIESMLLQPDGKLVIGGQFTNVNAVARRCIARLNTDGSLDTSFDPGTGLGPRIDFYNWDVASVKAMGMQADGKLIIAYDSPTYNDIFHPNLARINSDGSLDETFTDYINIVGVCPYSVLVQPDGKIVLGGQIDRITIGGVQTHYPRGMVRLNPDGSLDSSFAVHIAGANEGIGSVYLLADGSFLVDGSFYTVDNVARTNLAKLRPDGSLDPSYIPPNGWKKLVGVQPDGKCFICQSYSSSDDGYPLLRLNADGSVDPTWQIAFLYGVPYSAIMQPDGRVILGGSFSKVNGVTRNMVARLDATGHLDARFHANLTPENGQVDPFIRIILLPDSRIILGGVFTSVNGQPANSLARLTGEPAATTLGPIGRQPDGRVRFTVFAQQGQPLGVEAASSLASSTWDCIFWRDTGPDQFDFVDTISGPQRFYRVLSH
jgi:uncharacterized delta-60 repeat protein